MISRRILFAIFAVLAHRSLAIAQSTDYPAVEQAGQSESLFSESAADGPIVPDDEFVEPHWFKPRPRPRSRFEFEIFPMTAHMSNDGWGFWTEDPAMAGRWNFGIENQSGLGIRLQAWSFEQEVDFGFGPVETRATTVYVEGYKQFFIDDTEVAFGGGLAVADMKFDEDRFHGAGFDVFAEIFSPLVRLKKTDFGVTAHARFAVVAPLEDYVIDDWLMTVDELGWGLELRRTVGRRDDKLITVEITRELQHWSGITEPFEAKQVFQGTALRFGYRW